MNRIEHLFRAGDILLAGDGALRERLYDAALEYLKIAPQCADWSPPIIKKAECVNQFLFARGAVRKTVMEMDESTVCEAAEQLMDLVELAAEFTFVRLPAEADAWGGRPAYLNGPWKTAHCQNTE